MVRNRLSRCVAFLSIFLLAGTAALAEPLVLRFATVAPEGTSWVKELDAYATSVSQATNNAVQIKIYSSSRMGDEVDVLRKMRSGQLQAGAFSNIGLGQVDSSARILDLPYLFQNEAEEDYVFERIYPKFEARFAQRGMKLGSLTDLGKVYIFSKTPMRTLEDVRKNKMWLWDQDMLTRSYYQHAKIVPVPLGIPDVFTALQTGMVTGVYMLPMGMIGFQWWQSLKSVSLPPLGNEAGAVLINLKDWNKISPENQKKMGELSWAVGKKITELSRQDNIKALEILKKNGFQSVEIEPKDLEEFHRIGAATRESLKGTTFDPGMLAEVDRLIAEYRSKKPAAASPTQAKR